MNRDTLFVQMALGAWNTYVERGNKYLESISDDDMQTEVAPGKNRIIYLVGHLIAIHDKLFELFGIGRRSHADLDQPFIAKPDREVTDIPDAATLRKYWREVHESLSKRFNEMSTDEWFTKHSVVSAEDFAKDPTRNKLNVVINRTNHFAYHLGQMKLVKK
jgi:hypothetical protein